MSTTQSDIASGLRLVSSIVSGAMPVLAAIPGAGPVAVGIGEAAVALLTFGAKIADQGGHVPTVITRILDAGPDFTAATAEGEKYARTGQ